MLWSVTFNTTVQALLYYLERSLLSGTELQVLLIKPDGFAIQIASFRNKQAWNEERIRARAKDTLQRLSDTLVSTGSQSQKNLNVRVIDYLTPWAMIAIDPELPTGYMYVRLNALHIPGQPRPSFQLSASEDKQWFIFFLEQFKIAWKASEPIVISEPNTAANLQESLSEMSNVKQ